MRWVEQIKQTYYLGRIIYYSGWNCSNCGREFTRRHRHSRRTFARLMVHKLLRHGTLPKVGSA